MLTDQQLTQLQSALADRYRLEHELGTGGMATVYLAEDVRHRRKVAIKVLHPELSAVLGGERFLKEIELTASLQHPHILPLFDSGSANGLLYYVMPYVEGETLRDRLTRERQLPLDDAVRTTREVADALIHAHARGVIHRDVKPENILLQGGHALVADFGIALAVQHAGGTRMTQTGLSLGTPQYMAPEQAMGDRVIDARADIYALGAVLYEMLVGDPPFTGSSVQAIVAKVLTDRPAPPRTVRDTVPPAVEDAVLRALAKLPADRFSTASEFATALTAPAAPRAAGARAGTAPARGGLPFWAAAVTLVLGAALGALAMRFREGAAPAGSPRPVRITHSGRVGCAAIAPDGRDYAAIVGDFSEETWCVGTLVIRAMPTGVDQVRAERLSGVTDLRWSPDGQRLLFAGSIDGVVALSLVDRGSPTVRRLRAGAPELYGFADDRTVFTLDGDTMRLLDIESGDQRGALALPPRMQAQVIAWHRSGQRFVMGTRGVARYGLYLFDEQGTILDSLPRPVAEVAWIGDDRLAIMARETLVGGDLLLQSLDAGGTRFATTPAAVLWPELVDVNTLSATANGDRVMLVRHHITDEQYLFDLRPPVRMTRLARALNGYLGDPRFSPDGRRIAYLREDALGNNVYWIAPEGGTEHAVTSDSADFINVEWIGEDRVIAWTGKFRMVTSEIGTGRLRRLGDPPNDRIPIGAWGNRWLWRAASTRELLLTDSLWTSVRTVPRPSGVVGSVRLGPRGSSIYVVVPSDSGFRIARSSGEGGDWSLSPIIREPGLVPTSVGDDGAPYLFRVTDHTEIWRMPSLDRPPALHATLPAHCYAGSVTVSPDGSRALCNVTAYDPDAWVVAVPPKR